LILIRQWKLKIEKSLGPLFDVFYFPYLLVDDLRSLRFFDAWFSSFRASQSLLEQGMPWLPFRAIDWLRIFLQPNMIVFEYGSGGSTIFLSRRVKQLFSVEHDPRWYALVSKALHVGGLTNCAYHLQEPQARNPSVESAASSSTEEGDMCFDRYVTSIDKHPDRSFDLVLVDGRSRPSCVGRAQAKVRPGGYLMLDNSNNDDVAETLDRMKSYPRIDFHGIAPGWPPARWTTTLWRIGS
jgi:hypothetical protein